MTSTVESTTRGPHRVPLRRLLSVARREGALAALEDVGRSAEGALTRVSLGPFRPYLVTHPAHLEHILRGNAGNYPRGAMMWKAFSRLTGEGIAGEGPAWEASRAILAPAFSGQYVSQITDQMADAVGAAVDDLAARAAHGPVDTGVEMTRVVQRVVNLVFFGNRIPPEDGDRLGAAISTAMGSFMWRMAMPFVPHAIPMPGDRRFHAATRTVDEILGPIVAESRRRPAGDQDVVARLLRGTGADGSPLTDEQVRDDIVGLFVAGSESSAVALTWLWVALDAHPDVAARLYDEVDRVVGDGPPRREHVRRLTYTRMVIQEVLRLYSVGWAVPRMATADDVIDGVHIRAGSTLVLSPYLTHRIPGVWEDPYRFDPERFTPERVKARVREHGRFAYLPFGLGVHECLGQHFFEVEAALIVASIVARLRPALATDGPVEPQLALTMRPRGPVLFTFAPKPPETWDKSA
ncbi:MAG TPA: cytochrome P450 [Thermomonospora sp.]|nr:cytochrome P450 [Thermomonospora sp.]